MKMESLSIDQLKAIFRVRLKKARSCLCESRRQEASSQLLNYFKKTLSIPKPILSFCNMKDEIDTSPLNHFLLEKHLLLLPKIENNFLTIYHITSLSHLQKNRQGLSEPDPTLCKKWTRDIAFALIPGLGFDLSNARIGYGKGFYDRFLIPLSNCQTIGIGFKEQLCKKIPLETHDARLSQILLF